MSTSFASLVTDVITLTNRPDLVNETNLAVKSAVIKAHQSDDYVKDLQDVSVQFTSADYFQTLDYKSVIPLWRKIRYARKYDAAGGAPGNFLKYIEPEKVTDEYGASRTDIFYVAGLNLQIRSKDPLQYLLLGVYLNPVTTAVGFNSWIADDHPFAIIYEAAATIFKTIGYDEQVPIYRQMVTEQYQLLRQHAISGQGY